MRILLIEDSERLCSSLSQGLSKLGYAVDFTFDGGQGLQYALNVEYDVIVLDIMLPVLDGLSVLKRLRKHNTSAHILILSSRHQVQDRIEGLRLGADDYLSKPFSFDELTARIGALVRRSYRSKNPVLQVGALKVNTALKTLSYDGKPVELTAGEFSLLEYLLMNRGRVVSYTQLEIHHYNAQAEVSRNAIEAHISSIRKKLAHAGAQKVITTRRGFGYLIDDID